MSIRTIYIANRKSKEVHRVPRTGQVSGRCQLDEITVKHLEFFTTLKDALRPKWDKAACCWKRGSKR